MRSAARPRTTCGARRRPRRRPGHAPLRRHVRRRHRGRGQQPRRRCPGRRRRADAGARVPRADRPVRRRDHGLGLAQPGRRQRAEGPRPRRPQARRRDRGRARAADLARRGAPRRHERGARPDHARGPTSSRPTSSIAWAWRPRSMRPACGSCSTAPTGRAACSGRASCAATGRDGRGHPRRARRREHQRPVAARPTPPRSRRRSLARGADVGFALDGDADRLIAVDAGGADRRRRPGPRHPRARPARARRPARRRPRGLGALERRPAGRGRGRRRARSCARPVGDKYILEGMQLSGAVLGGEKSGHVIVLEHTTSGDGIVTALEVLRVMAGRASSARRPGRPDPAAAAAAARGEGPPAGPVGVRPRPHDRRRGGPGTARDHTAASSSVPRERSPRSGSWSRGPTRMW